MPCSLSVARHLFINERCKQVPAFMYCLYFFAAQDGALVKNFEKRGKKASRKRLAFIKSYRLPNI